MTDGEDEVDEENENDMEGALGLILPSDQSYHQAQDQ